MSLCYDFQKWTIVSLASIAISLTIGLVLISMQYAHAYSLHNNTNNNTALQNSTKLKMTKCIVNKLPKFNDTDTLETYGEKAKVTGFSCVADVLQEKIQEKIQQEKIQEKIKALKQRFKIK